MDKEKDELKDEATETPPEIPGGHFVSDGGREDEEYEEDWQAADR